MEQDYCGVHVLEQRELLKHETDHFRSRHQESGGTILPEDAILTLPENVSFRLLHLNWNVTLSKA
jgi:hypothetical protein